MNTRESCGVLIMTRKMVVSAHSAMTLRQESGLGWMSTNSEPMISAMTSAWTARAIMKARPRTSVSSDCRFSTMPARNTQLGRGRGGRAEGGWGVRDRQATAQPANPARHLLAYRVVGRGSAAPFPGLPLSSLASMSRPHSVPLQKASARREQGRGYV